MTANRTDFTPREVGQRLGLSADAVRDLIRAGELHAIDVSLRPGRGKPRYRINLADLVAFQSRRKVLTAPARKPRSRKDPDVIEFFK